MRSEYSNMLKLTSRFSSGGPATKTVGVVILVQDMFLSVLTAFVLRLLYGYNVDWAMYWLDTLKNDRV